MPAERITFAINTPVELALRFVAGKPVESKFGTGLQHMFSTTDDRVFYVAEAAGRSLAEQLAALGTQPGEFVTITKAEVDAGRGRKQIRWIVAPAVPDVVPPPVRRMPPQPAVPTPQAGERSDGTYAVPALKPVAVPPGVPANAPAMPEWAQVLLASTNCIVDVYAAAVKHSMRYDGAVKPETVQSILVTTLINLSKNSSLSIGGDK